MAAAPAARPGDERRCPRPVHRLRSRGDLKRFAAELTSNCTAALQLLCNPSFQNLLVNYPRPRTAVVVAHTARDEVGSEGLIRAGSGREYRLGDYLET